MLQVAELANGFWECSNGVGLKIQMLELDKLPDRYGNCLNLIFA
jgi:hypothetical protein